MYFELVPRRSPRKLMRYYCTYFDHKYLPRGLALYHSLRQHSGPFRLWVLCLSNECHEILAKLALPDLEMISLNEFEQGDAPLLEAKQNRSFIEYYFTCTPSLPLFIFKKFAEVDAVSYLDGDLFFFADPERVHAEIGDHSIAITPHRFPPAQRNRERYGIFNVGWLTFRRDEHALACLSWWRERCLEWCYDRWEPTRFADQKYLDEWPKLFKNVKALEHPGINLALWNVANHHLRAEREGVLVDGRPLIFFHFHSLQQLSTSVFNPQWSRNKIKPCAVLRRHIYRPYLRALWAAAEEAGLPTNGLVAVNTRFGAGAKAGEASILRRAVQRFHLVRGVLRGKYLRSPRPCHSAVKSPAAPPSPA